MQTREYRTVAKDGWGDGPWQDEPDKLQFPDPDTGLPCLIVRQPHHGAFCGYVGVSPGHPLYKLSPFDDDWPEDVDIEVHGDLTYSNLCQPDAPEAEGICHVPDPGEEEHVWWLGFDCAHTWDFQPGRNAYYKSRDVPVTTFPDEVYRTLDFVRAETALLAAQLASLAPAPARVEGSAE